jgi:SAM-dependent methyltransferase
MQAFSMARQRLRERIGRSSTPQPVRLAHDLFQNRQGRLLPMLPSALVQDILTRGYDPLTIQRVYSDRPSGDLGLVGKVADRFALNLPIHEALRERLAAAAGEICAAAIVSARSGKAEFRVLSAACGLAQELIEVENRLRRQDRIALRALRVLAVDRDPDRTVLDEARRRLQAHGIDARCLQEDTRRHGPVARWASQDGGMDLISATGLSQQRRPGELADLVRFYAGLLAPGGVLLLDRWRPAEQCSVTEALGVQVPHFEPVAFRTLLGDLGLAIEREHTTGEGGCVLSVARKLG